MIELANLPFPKVIESIDFENLLAKRKNKFISLWEDEEQKEYWRKRLQLESEPVVKLLEENAYLELLLRERINNAAKSVMLAFASGSDLDHLGALFGVQRLVIREEDLTVQPPIYAEYESDDRLRKRIQMSLDRLSTAGSRGSYKYHALSASPLVKDVTISSPKSGTVQVTVLSTENNGQANNELLGKVDKYLNAEEVRPLCDTVQVKSAQIINYQIEAELVLFPSVIEHIVLDNANATLLSYIQKQHHLGLDITRSGIFAALHQEGVQNVRLISPQNDLIISPTQAGFCTAINIRSGGIDE
ncbi:baseplate assembly protein [Rodentibacter abscessus]